MHMTKEAVLGVIRHILTFGGGFVTSGGLATADEIAAAVGAIVTIIGTVWSVIDKRKKND